MKRLKMYIVFFAITIVFSIMLLSNEKKSVAADDARVMLESYKVTKGAFSPGEVVTASLKFKNTSTTQNVSSVLITYNNTDGLVSPASGETNQIYIESIEAGKSVTKDIKFVVAENAGNWKNVKVNFSINFLKNGNVKDTNEVTALFSFSEKCSLDVINFSVTKEKEDSDSINVALYVTNVGNIDMTNVVMHLLGANGAKMEIKIDDIKQNASVNKNYNVALPQNDVISAYFTYSDVNGSKYTSETNKYNVDKEQNIKDEQETSIISKLLNSKLKIIAVIVAFVGILILWGIGKKKE